MAYNKAEAVVKKPDRFKRQAQWIRHFCVCGKGVFKLKRESFPPRPPQSLAMHMEVGFERSIYRQEICNVSEG